MEVVREKEEGRNVVLGLLLVWYWDYWELEEVKSAPWSKAQPSFKTGLHLLDFLETFKFSLKLGILQGFLG